MIRSNNEYSLKQMQFYFENVTQVPSGKALNQPVLWFGSDQIEKFVLISVNMKNGFQGSI